MSEAALSQASFRFNPVSPESICDPYPEYHRLRTAAPVYLSPLSGAYILSRYEDCQLVLRDPRFAHDTVQEITSRFGAEAMEEPIFATMRHSMMHVNPPDHSRLRRLFAKAFSTRTVENMRPRIQAIVDASLDRVASSRHMDLMRDFAFHLPVTVICEMLGIPKEDHADFIDRADYQAFARDPTARFGREELDAINAETLKRIEYFRNLFERRRREPGDDLTSQLVQAEEVGDKLTEAELISNVMLLFGAGHVTTINLIGNGLLALLRNPDQLALLKRDPALMPNAIEELLRYEQPVMMVKRIAREEVKLGGVSVPRGKTVLCLLGAANRDPAVFPDPDRLDITRPNIRFLSFGGGIHFCLGAQLGRIEAEIAFNSLFARLPDITLDNPDTLDWRNSYMIRGLTTLPASW